MEISKRVEKFIQDCTRNCSNEFEPQKAPPSVYNPWLTPDDARKAVEIAREEVIEKACDFLLNTLGLCVPYYDDNDNFHAHGSRTIIIEKLHKTFIKRRNVDMSKAEEKAKKRYWLEPSNIETQEKYAAYVEGYHQAEKDNELTWEDIKTIDKLLNQCVDYSNPYQEVLKRFKDYKERKEK